jgi:prolyl 4-hydroxylase
VANSVVYFYVDYSFDRVRSLNPEQGTSCTSTFVTGDTANRFSCTNQTALSFQDSLMTPPVYNGVNPSYPGLRVLNNSPPIFAVENFLTPYECDFLIHAAVDALGPAPVVGKGAGEISPSRTSSTCYLAREDLGDLMRKVSLLTGKPPEHCELPQVGRYFYQEKYLQHFDGTLIFFLLSVP